MKLLFTIAFCLTFLFSTFCLNNPLLAQAGELDSTFSKDGQVITKINGSVSITGIIALTDGKVVTAGTLTSIDTKAIIIKYNYDGSLNKSFGNNGIDSLFIFNGQSASVSGITFTPDGKIVIAGAGIADSTNLKGLFVYKLNKDGSLDSSFNGDGKLFTSFSSNPEHFRVSGVAVQPDGKIIVSGTLTVQAMGKWMDTFLAARYDEEGNLDTTFNHSGLSYSINPSLQTENNGIKLLKNGKIILFGSFNSAGGLNFPNGIVTRYNNNGTIDSLFGTNGSFYYKQEYYNSSYDFWVYALDEQPDDKLIFCGLTIDGTGCGVSRLTYNGTIDSSFGKNGFISVIYDSGWSNYAFSVDVQPDYKIIISGGSRYNSRDTLYNKFAVARLKPDGSTDSIFGANNNGITSNFFKKNLNVMSNAMCVTNDRIYLAGYEYNGYSNGRRNYQTAIAAYLKNDNILPVRLLNFTAQNQNNTALLQWQTTNEINNSYFNIERSSNSKTFSSIGTKQALNNSGTNYYSFIDNSPLKGINYYRLKQVDKDGKFSYSGVASVEFLNDGSVFAIAPNPANNIITVIIPSSNAVSEIIIYDVNGKKLLHEQLAANTTSKPINISVLATGVYNIVLIQNGKKEMMKLVKK